MNVRGTLLLSVSGCINPVYFVALQNSDALVIHSCLHACPSSASLNELWAEGSCHLKLGFE